MADTQSVKRGLARRQLHRLVRPWRVIQGRVKRKTASRAFLGDVLNRLRMSGDSILQADACTAARTTKTRNIHEESSPECADNKTREQAKVGDCGNEEANDEQPGANPPDVTGDPLSTTQLISHGHVNEA